MARPAIIGRAWSPIGAGWDTDQTLDGFHCDREQ